MAAHVAAVAVAATPLVARATRLAAATTVAGDARKAPAAVATRSALGRLLATLLLDRLRRLALVLGAAVAELLVLGNHPLNLLRRERRLRPLIANAREVIHEVVDGIRAIATCVELGRQRLPAVVAACLLVKGGTIVGRCVVDTITGKRIVCQRRKVRGRLRAALALERVGEAKKVAGLVSDAVEDGDILKHVDSGVHGDCETGNILLAIGACVDSENLLVALLTNAVVAGHVGASDRRVVAEANLTIGLKVRVAEPNVEHVARALFGSQLHALLVLASVPRGVDALVEAV